MAFNMNDIRKKVVNQAYDYYGNPIPIKPKTSAPNPALSGATAGANSGTGSGAASAALIGADTGIVNNTPPNETQNIVDAPVTDTSSQDYINQLKQAQLASRIAALDKSRNNALANLDAEQAGIEPRYYGKRNEAAAASDIGAMNFAQFMASRGIKGASGAMPEIYRNNALQNTIGGLNQQEQSAFDTIGRNRTGIQNNYESDVAAANSDVEAMALQAYIDQMNRDREFGLQEAGLMGTYNGQPTLGKLQFGLQESGVTGTYKGQPTLANQQFQSDEDYRNKAFNYNVTKDNRDYNYQVSRDQVLDDRWLDQFDYQQQQDILNRSLQERQISNDEYQARTSRINANNAANQDATQNQWEAIKNYANQINNLYTSTDITGAVTRDLEGIKAYIQNLNTTGQIDDNKAKQLLSYYGFSY